LAIAHLSSFCSSASALPTHLHSFPTRRSSDLWMPDRTEANPNELNQDEARYGFRCCHLKNIWTAPLPPETELSRQMTTSTTSIEIGRAVQQECRDRSRMPSSA